MPDMEDVKEKIQHQHEEVTELQKAMYTLIEAQKNTTRNVDALALDVKEMLKNSLNCEIIEKEVIQLEARIQILEESKSWGFKLIVGAVIMSLIGLVLDYKMKGG